MLKSWIHTLKTHPHTWQERKHHWVAAAGSRNRRLLSRKCSLLRMQVLQQIHLVNIHKWGWQTAAAGHYGRRVSAIKTWRRLGRRLTAYTASWCKTKWWNLTLKRSQLRKLRTDNNNISIKIKNIVDSLLYLPTGIKILKLSISLMENLIQIYLLS